MQAQPPGDLGRARCGRRHRDRQARRGPLRRRCRADRRSRGRAGDRDRPRRERDRRSDQCAAHVALQHPRPGPVPHPPPGRRPGAPRPRHCARCRSDVCVLATNRAHRGNTPVNQRAPAQAHTPVRCARPAPTTTTRTPLGAQDAELRPDRQRDRRRPEHGLEHRAVLPRAAHSLGKPGVGLYLDAPGRAARVLGIHTTTPGFACPDLRANRPPNPTRRSGATATRAGPSSRRPRRSSRRSNIQLRRRDPIAIT